MDNNFSETKVGPKMDVIEQALQMGIDQCTISIYFIL